MTLPASTFLVAVLMMTMSCNVLASRTTTNDRDAAWKSYLKNDTDIPPSYRFPHASCFKAASSAHGLPESLLLAVARGESDFVPTARSKANAHGVMQILWPGTANDLGIYRLTHLGDDNIQGRLQVLGRVYCLHNIAQFIQHKAFPKCQELFLVLSS